MPRWIRREGRERENNQGRSESSTSESSESVWSSSVVGAEFGVRKERREDEAARFGASELGSNPFVVEEISIELRREAGEGPLEALPVRDDGPPFVEEGSSPLLPLPKLAGNPGRLAELVAVPLLLRLSPRRHSNLTCSIASTPAGSCSKSFRNHFLTVNS